MIGLCKTSDMAERDGDGWVACRCGSKHWGKFGAAGLVLIHEERVLLQYRAPWVHNGDTWGIPGGARDSHESSIQAALREAHEEIGVEIDPLGARLIHLEDHGDWSYQTIVAFHHGEQLTFVKNHETQDLQWFEFHQVEQLPLHPSFARSWPEINARILGIDDVDASKNP